MAADLEPKSHGAEPGGALAELAAVFAGRARGWGIFEDRFGRLKRSFRIDIAGRYSGSELVIDEAFVYGDGARENRTWHVVSLGGGRFRGTCPDCVGEAIGEVDAAGVIRMRYAFRLAMKARSLVVDFDDRIYRIDGGRAINRATVTKWGVTLGTVSLFLERLADQSPRRAA